MVPPLPVANELGCITMFAHTKHNVSLVLVLLAFGVAWSDAPAPALHPLLEPAFQQTLNHMTNSVLSVSDDTQVLVNGTASYPVRWRMLEEARKSIHFSTMYIFADETTKRLADTLIRKKREGVDVKMIVFGTYALGNLPFYKKMRRNGIEVEEYGPIPEVLFPTPYRFWKKHLHDKYLVVDGQEAISGGMNWSARYEHGGTDSKIAWRDTDIYVRGPQAAIMEAEFAKRWNREVDNEAFRAADNMLAKAYEHLMYPPDQRYEDFIEPDARAPYGHRVHHLTRFLYQQPFEYGVAHMTPFFTETMNRAQSHIYWQSISIRPAPLQRKALMDAARRGVDVRVMTNSKRNMRMIPIGGGPVYYLTHKEYRPLLEAGIRIFEYSGTAPMHSKGFLVDDVVAAVGSYNATFTAEKYYTESAIATYDTDAVQAVKNMFDTDFAQCSEVTLASLGPKAAPAKREPRVSQALN